MPDSKFDISLYNDEFFEWHLKHARVYSIKTMDWFMEKYGPPSVVDFGCGIGSYLESAYNHGAYVFGLEISRDAQKYTPDDIRHLIFYYDCTQPISLMPFDCVISFETAEHIDPKGTDQFIENLVNATGKWLLFTAAPPGQDGCGHINCHPKEYWIEKFSEHLTFDYKMTNDILQAWSKLGAPDYICNNLIVFKR